MGSRRRRPVRRIIVRHLLWIADVITPSTDHVVLHSQPDLDDNVVSLLRGAPSGPVTVLVDDRATAVARAARLSITAQLVPRRSWRGLLRYLRAGTTITSHGLYGSAPRPRRRVICLWHGEFGKRIGRLAHEPKRHADWMPVASPLGQIIRSAEFDIDLDRLPVVGSPRQTLLRHRTETSLPPGPHVVWAPTFRATRQGPQRTDGDPAALWEALTPRSPALLELLGRHGATLWFRPHPADAAPPDVSGAVPLMADDCSLERRGLTFYELLAHTGILITDYSSLWVDWLLLDRPALSYVPDLEIYRTSRGLVLEPHDAWFPGEVTTTPQGLLSALDDTLAGQDRHAPKRAVLRGMLHPLSGQQPTIDPVGAVWAATTLAVEERSS